MYQTVFSVEGRNLTEIYVWAGAFGFSIVIFNLWLRRKLAAWLRWAATVTFGLVAAIVIATTYQDIVDSRSWAQAAASGTCAAFEGTVKVIQREEPHGSREKIEIDGHTFEFSYSTRGAHYHATLAHGGVLQDGAQARVCAVGQSIVRVDLRH